MKVDSFRGSGIYCFENKVNNKKYVGQAVNIEKRMKEHIRHLKKNKDFCSLFQKAWNKYGEESFYCYIIEKCPVEELNIKEIYYIDLLDSLSSKNGYNILIGGNESFRGYKHSEETKRKMRISHGGNPDGPSKSSPRVKKDKKKRSHSEETKQKMSKSRIGKKTTKARSSYYGVVVYLHHKKNIRFRAQCCIKGIHIYLGQFKEEVEAARVYDKYIIENNLPNPLNFPIDK